MQSRCKLSIVTPSFNQGQFIRKTLDSVLTYQDYSNVEHWVIDGGSKDDTLNILREYKERYPNVLNYSSEPDRGQSHAINKGFMRCKGDIIGWINSDDYYAPNIFRYVLNFFDANPDVGMIIGGCHVVDKDGRFIMDLLDGYAFKKCRIDPKNFKYDDILNVTSEIVAQPAVFFRREVFDKVGYLDESLHFVMDYEYWLRIGRHFKIVRVDKLLAFFRTHEDAKTTFRNRLGYIAEALHARRKNGGGLITRFYLYAGLIFIKTIGKMTLLKLGLLRSGAGTIGNGKT